MENGERKVQYFRVKRKANEDIVINHKRCKLIASINSNESENVDEVIKARIPSIKDCEIIDYEDVVNSGTLDDVFQRGDQVITCNDEKLEVVDNNEDYVFDIYLYEALNNEQLDDGGLNEDEEEVSSCDENYPCNEYPDEEEYDYNEYDYYRQWEYDDEKDVCEAFSRSAINDDYDLDDESDSDGFESIKRRFYHQEAEDDSVDE